MLQGYTNQRVRIDSGGYFLSIIVLGFFMSLPHASLKVCFSFGLKNNIEKFES